MFNNCLLLPHPNKNSINNGDNNYSIKTKISRSCSSTRSDAWLHADCSDGPSLVQTTASQIVGDNDIGDGVEHKLNVVGIRCTSHVTVDFL